jgi:hypothetical protein
MPFQTENQVYLHAYLQHYSEQSPHELQGLFTVSPVETRICPIVCPVVLRPGTGMDDETWIPEQLYLGRNRDTKL